MQGPSQPDNMIANPFVNAVGSSHDGYSTSRREQDAIRTAEQRPWSQVVVRVLHYPTGQMGYGHSAMLVTLPEQACAPTAVNENTPGAFYISHANPTDEAPIRNQPDSSVDRRYYQTEPSVQEFRVWLKNGQTFADLKEAMLKVSKDEKYNFVSHNCATVVNKLLRTVGIDTVKTHKYDTPYSVILRANDVAAKSANTDVEKAEVKFDRLLIATRYGDRRLIAKLSGDLNSTISKLPDEKQAKAHLNLAEAQLSAAINKFAKSQPAAVREQLDNIASQVRHAINAEGCNGEDLKQVFDINKYAQPKLETEVKLSARERKLFSDITSKPVIVEKLSIGQKIAALFRFIGMTLRGNKLKHFSVVQKSMLDQVNDLLAKQVDAFIDQQKTKFIQTGQLNRLPHRAPSPADDEPVQAKVGSPVAQPQIDAQAKATVAPHSVAATAAKKPSKAREAKAVLHPHKQHISMGFKPGPVRSSRRSVWVAEGAASMNASKHNSGPATPRAGGG